MTETEPEEAVEDEESSAEDATPEADVGEDEGIFKGVVGHKGAKSVVRGALRSGEVDVLLIGPPASGKSTILEAVEENVPGTVYRDGNRFTATRVQSTFAEDPPIILVDEIDALNPDGFEVLSNPMEHDRITEDTADETYDIEVGTQVIAACNSTRPIPDNILSRFRQVKFEGYSKDEYVDVCAVMLPERVEWVDGPETGRKVGEIVNKESGTTDPRDARDAALMVSSLDEVKDTAVGMQDADADVDSDPIRPDEVARAKTDVGREKLRRMVENGGEADVDADEIDREIDREVRRRLKEREEEL